MDYFNPHSHEGSDEYPECILEIDEIFQSTLPRRERLQTVHFFHCLPKFQSTLPRRERLRNFTQIEFHIIFQSTLPRRERQTKYQTYIIIFQFQSTLPRRERPSLAKSSTDSVCISIHTPTKGATRI